MQSINRYSFRSKYLLSFILITGFHQATKLIKKTIFLTFWWCSNPITICNSVWLKNPFNLHFKRDGHDGWSMNNKLIERWLKMFPLWIKSHLSITMQWRTELKGNFQFHTNQIYYSYIFISSRIIEKHHIKKCWKCFLFVLFMARKSIFFANNSSVPNKHWRFSFFFFSI